MKKRIAVVTEDQILYNKIKLLLRYGADVSLLGTDSDSDGYDAVFHDMRCGMPSGKRTVLVGEGGDLPICFLYEDLFTVFESLDGADADKLVLSADGRHVRLFGKEIKLTELEYRLLGYLVEKRDFVSRKELLDAIWNGEHDEGVVTVYVHYLRQKLEKDGNKVIISSRKYGYKLNGKYIDGRNG